jgi:plasmid stabilization system protein ParE
MNARRLKIRPLAQLDLAEAALWYQQQRRGLGDEFLEEMGIAFNQICERPESFPTIPKKHIRRALANRFPYAVFFTLTEELISIIAVFHTSRDLKRLLKDR